MADLPSIGCIGEEFRSTESFSVDRHVPAHGVGFVEQEAGDVIRLTTRRGLRCALRRAQARNISIESQHAARILVLPLRQIVAETVDIHTPLEGVIPVRFGPVVGDVQVGFAADPRQACRITSQAVIPVIAGQYDAGHPAGVGVSEVGTRDVDADFALNCLAAIGVVSHVPIVVNAGADFHDEAG